VFLINCHKRCSVIAVKKISKQQADFATSMSTVTSHATQTSDEIYYAYKYSYQGWKCRLRFYFRQCFFPSLAF